MKAIHNITCSRIEQVAEVCICYTSDLTTSDIYTLEYYKSVTRAIVDAGAHIIAIKDMAGLLKPRAAAPLVNAIREVSSSRISSLALK
jgi:pyruvate carboxylase